MERIYTSTAHFRAPFDTPNISFAGLGADWQRQWPAGRSYYDIASFRSPYDDGYYQRGNLRGIGELAPAYSGILRGTVAAAALGSFAAALGSPRGLRGRGALGGAFGGALIGLVASVFAVAPLRPASAPSPAPGE